MFICESANFCGFTQVLHDTKIAVAVVRCLLAGSHPIFNKKRATVLVCSNVYLSLFFRFDPLTCKNAALNAYIRNENGQKTVISWKRSR